MGVYKYWIDERIQMKTAYRKKTIPAGLSSINEATDSLSVHSDIVRPGEKRHGFLDSAKKEIYSYRYNDYKAIRAERNTQYTIPA